MPESPSPRKRKSDRYTHDLGAAKLYEVRDTYAFTELGKVVCGFSRLWRRVAASLSCRRNIII